MVPKENKARANEIVRLANDLDRSKMDNEGLRRDNGKLSDEVRALKMELDALKKRFHELDSENRSAVLTSLRILGAMTDLLRAVGRLPLAGEVDACR